MKKKGQNYGLGSLIGVILVFVIVGLLAVFSLEVMEETQNDFGKDSCASRSDGFTYWNATARACYNSSSAHVLPESAAWNQTGNSIDGVGKIPSKMPTLGNVVIAAVIIGVLLAAFGGFVASKRL